MTVFLIERPEFNIETGEVHCNYALNEHRFTEKLELGVGFDIDAAQSESFARALDLAAAILGVSYFKLCAPFQIDATAIKLTEAAQQLVRDVYENGLGEFYARNNLERFGKIEYQFRDTGDTSGNPAGKIDPLILIGGGKDSLLSVNLIEEAGWSFTPFAVNPKGPIISSIERMDQKPFYVRRYLDQTMLALNSEPGYFNGHVPSTAINSIIASLVAILYGKSHVILSNERSASEGNLEFDGREVNHQHSKSLAFEKLFASALESIVGKSIGYFSLLRPFSELQIGALFLHSTKFDGAFSSCNQNFKQNAIGPARWCGNCPKCHFVSLIFAPFISPERLTNIVGTNVLDDETKLDAMRELSGLSGHKPWECVGEILEAAAALWQLSQQPQWQNSAIVKTLTPELEAFYGATKLASAWLELMTPSNSHAIPQPIYNSINQKELGHAS
ncbi:hypothetical protein [Maritalea porphyrae]|uniref:UDP-N-acetyl-alpha-D-muramoyl-L-alanyl-L-glutamate epimerase n=1 Tax=Maritalea porphyrae TaxID=880732 RepID=A0ABQ5UM77_9HYPH|nr:hypothetical protein [Maritalea porphyrae]GLQ15767.1 hypothetical protein GCM10007879_00160 [Maritalea porphyrae]